MKNSRIIVVDNNQHAIILAALRLYQDSGARHIRPLREMVGRVRPSKDALAKALRDHSSLEEVKEAFAWNDHNKELAEIERLRLWHIADDTSDRLMQAELNITAAEYFRTGVTEKHREDLAAAMKANEIAQRDLKEHEAAMDEAAANYADELLPR